MNETDKRLEVLNKVLLAFDQSVFEGIVLTGSLSFGQYYSIKKTSDIDLLFIIKKKNLRKLSKQDFFKNAEFFCDDKLKLMRNFDALFWCDQFINNVKINMGFCTLNYFKEFCNLRARKWIGSKENKIIRKKILKTINNKTVNSNYLIKKYKKLYLLTFDLYIKCELVSNPLFSNLFFAKILYDKGEIKNNLIKLKENLIKKYGKNTLNLFDYVMPKLSLSIKEKIIEQFS